MRLVSLDAYRGLVMILMVSAGLRITEVVRGFASLPAWRHLKTPLWEQLARQTDHCKWVGCTLWDLIQPSFMFMVGAALAFSIANRQAKGQSFLRQFLHALFRSAALVLLSVFLASNGKARANWSFTIVLAQIGLGYPFLFLLAWLKPRWQLAAVFLVLLGYWSAFALYPRPATGLDPQLVNLPANWERLEGFAAHWEKNTNAAARVDRWFLNLFPQADARPFIYEPGGYQTLNFVPSLATMIFGLLAGELVRGRLSAAKKVGVFLGAAVAGLAVGWTLDRFGICPMVKRIWTPTFAIYSAGWAFGVLGIFYLVADVWRVRLWTYPLVVVGANSIAVYCISMMLKPWVRENVQRFFGRFVYWRPVPTYAWLRYHGFENAPCSRDSYWTLGGVFAPMADATVFLLFCWLVCWWMYRKKIFIKI